MVSFFELSPIEVLLCFNYSEPKCKGPETVLQENKPLQVQMSLHHSYALRIRLPINLLKGIRFTFIYSQVPIE